MIFVIPRAFSRAASVSIFAELLFDQEQPVLVIACCANVVLLWANVTNRTNVDVFGLQTLRVPV